MGENVEPLILFNHANGAMAEPYSITEPYKIGGNDYVSAYTLQLGRMNVDGGTVVWYFDITKYKQLTIDIFSGYTFKDLITDTIYSIEKDGVRGLFDIRDTYNTTTGTKHYLSDDDVYGRRVFDVSDIKGFVYLAITNNYYERPVAIQHVILE